MCLYHMLVRVRRGPLAIVGLACIVSYGGRQGRGEAWAAARSSFGSSEYVYVYVAFWTSGPVSLLVMSYCARTNVHPVYWCTYFTR